VIEEQDMRIIKA